MPVVGAFTVTAYICVNCQQRNPSECRIFTGPDAKRCVIGHINGTKACRKAQAGYTEILVPYNARDRIVGGSGTAAPQQGFWQVELWNYVKHSVNRAVKLCETMWNYMKWKFLAETVKWSFGQFGLRGSLWYGIWNGSVKWNTENRSR